MIYVKQAPPPSPSEHSTIPAPSHHHHSHHDAKGWLVEKNVAPLLNRLIEDMLEKRPHDVEQFIRQWSRTLNSSQVADAAMQTDRELPEDQTRTTATAAAVEVCDEGEADVAEEASAAIPSVEELSERFPMPSSSSLQLDPDGRHVGSGNYGHVVLGWLNSDIAAPSAAAVGKGTRRVRVAVKQVRVTKYWHLDEAEHLDDITVHAAGASTAVEQLIPRRPDESDGLYRTRIIASIFEASRSDDDMLACAGHWNVVKLARPCFFDPSSNLLMFPMTYVPYPLDAIVAKRRDELQALRKASDLNGPVEEEVGAGGRVTIPPRPRLFTIAEIRAVVRQVVLALCFLTLECKKCHLDLKPANILLSLDGSSRAEGDSARIEDDESWFIRSLEDAHVALCDFGLTQNIGTTLFQLGDFFYMPPEIYFEGRGVVKPAADPGEGEDLHCQAHHSEDDDDDDADSAVTEFDRRDLDIFTSTHDTWSLGCCVLFMLDGLCAFSWKEADYFAAMRQNYVAPMPKHPSDHPPLLLSFLALCFERDWRRRPRPEDLARHPFLAATSAV